MALSDNKLKIQELIDTINALPGAGGGGGGLPTGISKLASGTITPLIGIYQEEFTIEHGLNVTPNFYFVVSISHDPFPDGEVECWQAGFRVDAAAGNEYGFFATDGIIFSNGLASSASIYTPTREDIVEYPLVDENYLYITAPALFPAGRTYRWVCGVIDALNPEEV